MVGTQPIRLGHWQLEEQLQVIFVKLPCGRLSVVGQKPLGQDCHVVRGLGLQWWQFFEFGIGLFFRLAKPDLSPAVIGVVGVMRFFVVGFHF